MPMCHHKVAHMNSQYQVNVRSKVKGEAEVSHMAACGQVNKERCTTKANVWNEYYTTQLLITVHNS